MHSHHLETQLDYPDSYHHYSVSGTVWDRLQQPGIIISLVLLLVTCFYQSLHSSPFSRARHPGELLWDFIIAIIPAKVLYALDNWLHPPMFPTSKSMSPNQSRSYVAKGELLRRILGMDKPGGIINSVAHAGRRSLSTLSGGTLVKRQTDQPPGLGNYDNSCFQNSILQGLSSLKPLPAYLAAAPEHEEADQGEEDPSSASSLRDLIFRLTDASNNGMTLWTPKKLKSLDTWQQQDAQEYFSKILDEVDKEITKAARAQVQSPGFETACVRDDTEDSQHSDDSGYHSLSVFSKVGPDVRIWRNPLEGLVAQRVACIQCGHSDGFSMIPFNCLTLNLGLDQMGHDLYERLDSYTDLEFIEGVECAKCTLLKVQRLLKILISRGKDIGSSEDVLQEPLSRLEAVELALEEDDFGEGTLADKCKISAQHRVSSTKTKQVAIARAPQSLAIHMNRSVFDDRTGQMLKNFAAVRFPRTLDLGPWCLGSASGISALGGDSANNSAKVAMSKADGEEQWMSDPKSSMVSGDLEPSKITGPIYELRAVVTHQGKHENGHYICYRKHPYRPSTLNDDQSKKSDFLIDEDDGSSGDEETLTSLRDSYDDPDLEKWWRLSDESVTEVSEEVVLAQGGVFMLFYDCVDPNSVLTPAARHQAKADDNDAVTATGPNVTSVLELGHTEGDLQNRVLETGEQFDDTRSDREAMEPSRIAPQSNEPVGLVGGSYSPSIKYSKVPGQRTGTTSSHILPLLADGEQVDPTIPLRRPN
ncbi:cysteine proteinase [Xylariaceae sp. FL0662B]|nr:cysteine proteinase [Xylariaceae sp. FL0662B]